MILVFLAATTIVLLAEMADKTQLLAMAFAARFPVRFVLAGVLVATLVNNALAVAVGGYLGTTFDFTTVQMIAAASFIAFGLWTLRGDGLHREEEKKSRYGPAITVALAFFVAEMGDKTQLAAAALAAKYRSPIAVLLGATAGMMIANVIGIYVGNVAGKRLPEEALKWASASVFIAFGYIGLYTSLPRQFVTAPLAAALVVVTVAAVWGVSRTSSKRGERS